MVLEENEDFKYKSEFNKDIIKGKGENFFLKNKESYEGEFEEGKINEFVFILLKMEK